MKFSKFSIGVIIRLSLIAALLCLDAYLIFGKQQYVRSIYLGVFIVLLFGELLRFVTRLYTNIQHFLDSLKWEDYNVSLSESTTNLVNIDLKRTFNEIAQRLQKSKIKERSQMHFIQNILTHSHMGILCIAHDQRVMFVNSRFYDLAGLPPIKNGEMLHSELQYFLNNFSNLPSGGKQKISVRKKHTSEEMYCYYNQFSLDGNTFYLYSIHNISSEIQENRLESWNQLIQVLTHEIMNSTSPIYSLSSSLRDISSELHTDDHKRKQQLHEGLTAINERSHNLMRFTTAYHEITKLPKPVIREIDTESLLKHIVQVYSATTREQKINLSYEILPDAKLLRGDLLLIQQALINLVKNAIEACAESKQKDIKLVALKSDKWYMIEISDSGTGIDQTDLEKIFVPFYSAKKGGTGIGLNISQQIMLNHGGKLDVNSTAGKGSIFTMIFPVS